MGWRRALIRLTLVAGVLALVAVALWPRWEILSEGHVAAAEGDLSARGLDAVVVEHTRLFGLLRSYRLFVGPDVVLQRDSPRMLCGHMVELPGDARAPEVTASRRTSDGGVIIYLSSGQRVALPKGAASPCR